MNAGELTGMKRISRDKKKKIFAFAFIPLNPLYPC